MVGNMYFAGRVLIVPWNAGPFPTRGASTSVDWMGSSSRCRWGVGWRAECARAEPLSVGLMWTAGTAYQRHSIWRGISRRACGRQCRRAAITLAPSGPTAPRRAGATTPSDSLTHRTACSSRCRRVWTTPARGRLGPASNARAATTHAGCGSAGPRCAGATTPSAKQTLLGASSQPFQPAARTRAGCGSAGPRCAGATTPSAK